jgi:hypothetical protein
MTAVVLVSLLIGMFVFGIALYDLQARLERWDHRRHAED